MLEAKVETASEPTRRVLANRLNSLRSTGPKTAEGKEKSRRNAVKHGLSGMGLVMPHELAEDAKTRCAAWRSALQPKDRVDAELVDLAATSMSQLRQCWRETTMARAQVIDRADQMWAEERRT